MMNHVCIVTRNMMSGGTERVIQQLIYYMTEHKYRVSLFLVDDKPINYSLPETCKVVVLGRQSNNLVADKFKRYKKIRNAVCKEKPDIVLSMPEEIGIYVIIAMLGRKIPVVVSERNDPWVMPYRKVTRVLRRMMYPFAAGLIFQTEQAAAFFPKRQQRKGIVLSNPLDLSRIPEPYVGEREKVIVSAGRLEKQKNFSLLIDAFTVFWESHPGYRLVIYGEGSLRNSLVTQAKANLPEGVVLFPGRVDDLLVRMNPCAVFALSSDYEGVPNVLIEAMAMGVPSVSTDCAPGGAASLISDGKNGLLTHIGDKTELANAMIKIIDHPDVAQKIASRAVTLREALDVRIIAKKWLEYLQQCCE